MLEAANPTPSAPLAPPAPCGPVWLAFCVLACTLFGALLGRLAPLSCLQSHHPSDDSPDSPANDSFAILLRLIAIDWFRRSRSAPATPAELLRRSPVAQAVLSQPLAPLVACDRPGETPAAGVFAPAFANQLAAASNAPLALTPSSFLNAYFATLSMTPQPALSARSRSFCVAASLPDATSLIDHSALLQSAIRNPQSAILHSAFRIQHSAFPRAPV